MPRIEKHEKIHPIAKLINIYADEMLKIIVEKKSTVGHDSYERIALNTLEKAICDKKTYKNL